MKRYQSTIATFDAVAEQYWQKFINFKPYQASYDCFCKALPQQPFLLLDVACGPGNVSYYLQQKKPYMTLLGIDAAPKMIDQAIKQNPNASFKIMDCREISTINQSFDAICCGFCLPYLTSDDALQLMTDMVELLNPNGIIYISFTADNQSSEGYQTSHSSSGSVYVHYHDGHWIKSQLELHGMKVIKQDQIVHLHNDQETKDEFIIARKNV